MARRKAPPKPPPETPEFVKFVTDYWPVIDGPSFYRALAVSHPGHGVTSVTALAKRLGLTKKRMK